MTCLKKIPLSMTCECQLREVERSVFNLTAFLMLKYLADFHGMQCEKTIYDVPSERKLHRASEIQQKIE